MKSILKLLMVVCLCGVVYGQTVNSGSFGASESHEYDSIDLSTLVPTFHFPVISKPGAIPLNMSIVSPQLCTFNGTAWVCGAAGLVNFNTVVSSALWGFTASSYTTVSGGCTTDRVTGLIDPNGMGYHPISATSIYYPSTCGANTANVVTKDGSYIQATITANGQFVNVSNVVLTNGSRSSLVNGYNATVDPFGNSLSLTGSVYKDTLGASDVGTNRSYVDTNGNTQSVTFTNGPNIQVQPYGDGGCGANTLPGSYAPITSIGYPDGTSFGIGWDLKTNGYYSGLVGSITLPTGGTVSYTYTINTVNCTIPEWSYSAITRTTPDGTTSYTSSNGVTTVLDPGKNKTVYTFIFANPGCTGSYCLPAPVLTQVQRYQNTNTVASPVYSLVATDTYCYNGNQTNCATTAIAYPITQRDTYHYVGSTSLQMSHATQVFDSYGNTTSSAAYDYITGQTLTTTATFSGCGQGSTILDHPCDVKTVNGANTLSETKYTYNSGGAILSVLRWTGTQWLPSTSVPNANGTPASTTDANGQVTTYAYNGTGGCNSILPTSASTTVNGVVISSANTWDCNTGLVLTNTDANGNTPPATYYDSMLRPVFINDNLRNVFRASYSSNFFDVNLAYGSSIVDSSVYTDSMGRPYVSQHQQSLTPSDCSTYAGCYDTISNAYAWNGTNFQKLTSAPCNQLQLGACPTIAVTELSNPVRGMISVTDALGGTVTYGYNKNDVSVTVGPTPTKTVQTEVDSFGRTKSVCAVGSVTGAVACGQVMGNSGILTSYAYSFGTGTSTVTATRGVQTHTSTADAMGRTTSVQTPEAGTITYKYDSATAACSNPAWNANMPGTLTQKQTQSGQILCYYHDTLGRLTTIFPTNCSSTNPNTSFAHDLPTGTFSQNPPSGANLQNTKGRLVEAETDDCAWPRTQADLYTDEWFSYDADGRVTDMWELTPHSGGYYHTWVTYNPNGTVASVNGIPGYAAYTFGVDGEGRTNSVAQGTSTYISGVTYDAASRPLTVSIGTSGDNDTFTYDTVERMKTYAFTVNGKSQTGTLTWNPEGTLDQLSIADTFNAGGAQTCTFAYDDAARLTDDNCGSTLWHQIFGYDQYDNLTKTGNPGTSWSPGYDPATNHMLGSTYDSDGHVVYDGNNTYTWNVYGKLAGVRSGASQPSCGAAGSYCPTYDALGRIVEASSGTTYKEFLFSPVGRLSQMSGQSVTETELPLPGGLTLKATGTGGTGGRYYMHNDWLGTTRLMTNYTRQFSWEGAYTPYGETYDVFGSANKLQFTGDFQDIFAGMFDTPNRELVTTASRWISPDPAGASWNAYSYPTNPNSETDTSGAIMDMSDCVSCKLEEGGDEYADGPAFYDVSLAIYSRKHTATTPFGLGFSRNTCVSGAGCGMLAQYAANEQAGSAMFASASNPGNLSSGDIQGLAIENAIVTGAVVSATFPQASPEEETVLPTVSGGSGAATGMAAEPIPENPLFEKIPGKTNWSFVPEGVPEEAQFGRTKGWTSNRIAGGTFARLDAGGAKLALGGHSNYMEGIVGMWRHSDHVPFDVRGFMTPAQISEYGGQMYENGNFWVFDNPITTFLRWENYNPQN